MTTPPLPLYHSLTLYAELRLPKNGFFSHPNFPKPKDVGKEIEIEKKNKRTDNHRFS